VLPEWKRRQPPVAADSEHFRQSSSACRAPPGRYRPPSPRAFPPRLPASAHRPRPLSVIGPPPDRQRRSPMHQPSQLEHGPQDPPSIRHVENKVLDDRPTICLPRLHGQFEISSIPEHHATMVELAAFLGARTARCPNNEMPLPIAQLPERLPTPCAASIFTRASSAQGTRPEQIPRMPWPTPQRSGGTMPR